MHSCSFLLSLLGIFSVSLAAKLPDDFPICKQNDEKLIECIKSAIQTCIIKMKNGIPELGASSIEPVIIPSATFGDKEGVVNVQQKFDNIKIHNISSLKIDKFKRSVVDGVVIMDMEMSVAENIFEADYEMKGRILLLPVFGNGKAKVILDDNKIKSHLELDTIEKNGKTYYNIKNYQLYLNPGKVIYNFENLFNGDEKLSAQMHEVMNENWKEVFDENKTNHEELLRRVFEAYINNIMSKVEIKHLFPKE